MEVLLTSDDCANASKGNKKGAYLGNGKIALWANYDGIGVQKCCIGGEFGSVKGVYKTNAIETFRTKAWSSTSSSTSTCLSQSLNMKTGMLTSIDKVANNVEISSDLYVVRQFPYCVMQTLRVNNSTTLIKEVCAGEGLENVEYHYDVIDTSMGPVGMLVGTGTKGSKTRVAFASSIVFENPDTAHLLGFNVLNDRENSAYVKIKLDGAQKVHCLSIHMTNFDFEDPESQCRLVVLSILNRSPMLASNAIQKLRQDHVNAWANLWKTDIILSARPLPNLSNLSNLSNLPNSSQVTTKAADLQSQLRKCLYVIYASTRERVDVEINPRTFGLVDTSSGSIYDGDSFLIPLLIYVMPNAARSLLEYRHKQLSMAIDLAASYGFAGAKFPYEDDIIGYKSALYWDASSPKCIFNTALVAINVWNMYRAEKDREWLLNKGYAILKSCADFFISRSSVDEEGNYHLNDVSAFNRNIVSNGHSYTNAVAKMAMKAALEASYELGYNVKSEWNDFMSTIRICLAKAGDGLNMHEVIHYDERVESQEQLTKIDVLDPLLILTPQLSRLYLEPGCNRGFAHLSRCVSYYKGILNPIYADRAINSMLISSVYGLMNRYKVDSMSDFVMHLDRLTAEIFPQTLSRTWECLPQDIGVSSMLPLLILNNMAGVNVQGGVAESKFYYEEMTIKGLFANNMPGYIENIKVTSCGPKKKSFMVLNQNSNLI